MWSPEEYENRACGYCGKTAKDNPGLDISTHSGVWECANCWTWRKLDGPAARYWNERIKHLAQNIDMYDASTFLPKRIGLSDEEMKALFDIMTKIRDKTDEMIQEHKR